MKSASGAGEENNRPATICLRSVGPDCPRSEGYGRIQGRPTGGNTQGPLRRSEQAVLAFLKDTRVGCISTKGSSERRGVRKGMRRRNQVGKGRKAVQARRICSSFVSLLGDERLGRPFPLFPFVASSFLAWRVMGEGRRGCPARIGLGQEYGHVKSHRYLQAAASRCHGPSSRM